MPAQSPALLRTAALVRVFSAFLSLVYVASIPFHPFPGRAIVKGASIAVLAGVFGRREPLVAIALLASATGDVLLDLNPAELFTAGLCAFAIAHIVYTVAFAKKRGGRRGRWIAVAAVVAYAGLFAMWLRPDLKEMTVPVFFYVCVITAMTGSAILSEYPRLVAAGAILFLASDSMLAVGKFKGTFPLRDYLVWLTYYAAQYAITAGVAKVSVTHRHRASAAATHQQ